MGYQYTRTFPAKKEQSFLFDTTETNDARYRGNGNDRHMPLGRKANGSIFRGAIKFEPDWSGMYQIVSARLVFRTTGAVHVTWGASPSLTVAPCSEYWEESGGSEGVWGRPGTAKSVYPGPDRGGGIDRDLAAVGYNDTKVMSITSIVESWAPSWVLKSNGAAGDGAANHGLYLKATADGSEPDRFEIYGMRAGSVGERPYIEVTYTANHPPYAPIVSSPAPGGNPTVLVSPHADTLVVNAYLSDVDPGAWMSYMELEAYGDGATDGAPGGRLGYNFLGAYALGPGHYQGWLTRPATMSCAPRTPFRYRVRMADNEGDWGAWTGLADGRVQMAYEVRAPRQMYMDPLTERPDGTGPHMYGTLDSNDPGDYISAVEIEVYRDTISGSFALWAPGARGIGGTSTRVDIEYDGASLVNGETIRWRMRMANRDGVVGLWGESYTAVYTPVGPDNLSPQNTSTKLTTRTPALTIAHSANFTGYRWQLYKSDQLIYDSQETACSSTSSVVVYPPAGLLAWGDGGEERPLTWKAQIRLATLSVYGYWSPAYGIRINALPDASATMYPAPVEGIVKVNDVRLWAPYVNDDQADFNEWPTGAELEIRVTASGGTGGLQGGSLGTSGEAAPIVPAAGGGALVERRYWPAMTNLPVSVWHSTGQRIDLGTSASTWTDNSAALSVGTVASAPAGYSGDSVRVTASGVTGIGSMAYVEPAGGIDIDGYGSGAVVRLWLRVSTYTNLGSLRVVLNGGNNLEYVVPALTPSTWTEVVFPLQWGTIGGAFTPGAIWYAGVLFYTTGSYTGTVDVRDFRIGTIQTAASTPSGHLANGTSYDWRCRYHDDADTKASTTLAADPAAGATNIKVTSVTGIAVGDSIVVGSASVPYEVREVTVVGTAGSGGTGLTLSDGLTWDHANGETLTVRYFGGWSSWLTAKYRPPPTVTLTSPSDAGTIVDPTPTLQWSMTDGSGVQASALVKVYHRVSASDLRLVWQGSVTGTTNTRTLPTLLLEHGKSYTWEVTCTDTYGASGTSSRWYFTTNFTVPAAVAGVLGKVDAAESAVDVSWYPTTDSYLDHYRVYWQAADGEWQRIDGGPEVVDDGNAKLVSGSTGAELVLNGTFPSALTSWTVADATSSTWLTGGGPDGTGCLRTIGDGTGTELVSQAVAIVVGRRYRFSLALYATLLAQAEARIVWQDGAYATVKTEPVLTNLLTSTWETAWAEYVAPAGAVYASVQLSIVDASTSEVRFDNVSLREAVTLRHYGARWGANDYRVIAHNGSQESEATYGIVTLTPPREGWWQVVCPTDQSYTYLLRIARADRAQASITERHDPPGRGSTVHISWGRGPFTVRAETLLRPSEDGDVASRLARLMRLGYGCWLKSPDGWGWDPVYCVLTDVQERPQTGGMLNLGLTFERTDDA